MFHHLLIGIATMNAVIDPRELFVGSMSVKDASFAFEGEVGKVDKNGWIPGEWHESFVGQGGFHVDGVVYREWQRPDGNNGTATIRLSLKRTGQMRKETAIGKDMVRDQLESQKENTPVMLADSNETWLTTWPSCMFLTISDAGRGNWFDEGEKVLDGAKCRVVERRDGRTIWRFWVDPAKNGNTVRFEKHSNGNLRSVSHKYEFREMLGKDGKRHLIPVGSVTDSFGKYDEKAKKFVYQAEPVTRAVYRIIADTVVINSGRSADSFEVKKRADVTIIDRNKPPQTPPTDVAQPGKNPGPLAEKDLKVAEDRERELLANQPVNRGVDLTAALTWGLTGAGVMAVVIGLILRWKRP